MRPREFVDVVTADGEPTGLRILKDDAHREGAWHRAAHLWVLTPGGKVLLQKRAAAKESWPGWWDVSVAGHVAAGETAIETVFREAREELGLEITLARYVGSLREQCVLHEGAYVDNEIHDIFAVTREIDIETLVLDANEVAAVALVDPDEARRWRVVPSSLRSLALVC